MSRPRPGTRTTATGWARSSRGSAEIRPREVVHEGAHLRAVHGVGEVADEDAHVGVDAADEDAVDAAGVSRFQVSWPSSVIPFPGAIAMASICRFQGGSMGHFVARSQPMSLSSMGSSGSRTLSGQHHAVPRRCAVASGAGVAAKGSFRARRRCGVDVRA